MKISAINNTNFKGLFTDKSNENNGNWKIEYQPYSWELTPYQQWAPREFGMSEQHDLDMFSEKLPDNEKIYSNTFSREHYGSRPTGRESCKDIFGTEFYYQDFGTNKMRKTITVLPAMSRENSLIVLNKKLETFIKMKKDLMNEKKSSVSDVKEEIENNSKEYNQNTYEIQDSALSRLFSSEILSKMDKSFETVKNNAMKTYNAFQDYMKLNESMQGAKNLYKTNAAEIELLKNARETGNLIDISRRDIYDPNKPLWNSIQEMIRTKTLETSKKLVALPHKTITMQEIVQALGDKIKSSNAPTEIINYIDNLIKPRVY